MQRVVRKNARGGVLRGVLLAVAVTVVFVVVFALVINWLDLSDDAIRIVNQLLKVSAVCFGVCMCVRRGGQNGLLRGAAVGALYMALGVAAYVALSGQSLDVWGYVADIAMGVAAGGLCGMLRANAKEKKAK